MSNLAEKITIERMAWNDVPEVHQLEVSCFTDPWDINSYYGEASNPTAHYFVARNSGKVMGFCGMWVVADEAHIVTMAVNADYRRRGLGRRLLQFLLDHALQLQVAIITLEVRVGNIAARQLYQQAGFSIVGTRRNYYPDNNEDALVMEITVLEYGGEA